MMKNQKLNAGFKASTSEEPFGTHRLVHPFGLHACQAGELLRPLLRGVVKRLLGGEYKGFTLVELILVMSIMGILFGFVTIALSNVRQRTTLNALTQTFISDIRQQQIRAMVGDTQGGAGSDSYGVHIDADKYVLFRGSTYDPADPSNFRVDLEDNFQFDSPGTNIIFKEITGGIPTPVTIGVIDTTTNQQKNIQLNVLGVVTSVN